MNYELTVCSFPFLGIIFFQWYRPGLLQVSELMEHGVKSEEKLLQVCHKQCFVTYYIYTYTYTCKISTNPTLICFLFVQKYRESKILAHLFFSKSR